VAQRVEVNAAYEVVYQESRKAHFGRARGFVNR
jgi:hypothetical protein